MKEPRFCLMLAHSLLGTGFFFLYVEHVRSIFESRTNIEHLTQLERESLLRREDALYYSFYKTLTEEPDFWSGYEKLKNVTGIEYPRSVNVLQRFYVLPEVTVGYFYHFIRSLSSNGYLPLFSCWPSNDIRLNMENRHCDNYALPMQFYFECVWLLGGFTLLILYMYGTLLSENIFGGIYGVISYVMFHSFAAKIYERPMARENFAFPFIFAQMFYVCMCIDRLIHTKEHRSRLFIISKLSLLTAFALLSWQFSSVLFATQVAIIMAFWSVSSIPKPISNKFTMDYSISQLLGIALAYLISHGNNQLLHTWQLSVALSMFLISFVRDMKTTQQQQQQQQQSIRTNSYAEFFPTKTMLLGFLLASSMQISLLEFLVKIGLTQPNENSYALYCDLWVHWVLQIKVNFVTSLSACNPAYARIAWPELWQLVKTLIVKPYCMYGVVMLAMFFRKWRKSHVRQTPNTEHVERAKNYVLEDFLEENHISMRDMSNKETERELNECLKLLEGCDYDYERYKSEKTKLTPDKPNAHLEFMNDIKCLKEQIHKIKDKQRKELQNEHNETEQLLDEELKLFPSTSNTANKPSKFENETNGNSSSNSSTSNSKSTPTISTKQNNTKRNHNSSQQSNTNNSNSGGGGGGGNCLNTNQSSSSSSSSTVFNASTQTNLMSLHYLYSFVQMGVFTIIGLSVRKLFFLSFTQGCVIAPTVCSKVWYHRQRNIFWSVTLAVFLLSMFDPGLVNIHEEYFPTRYKQNADDLDTMLEWIKMNTERDAVFAGPIEIIGTVHLTTKRPIVNHAHLEMRQISDRTEHVYSVYSRQQSSDIHNQCSQLKIQYLIISLDECTNEIKDDCDILSIWDDMQPAYRKYPQFCSELANKNVPSFLKVFSNENYSVIKMFSQSVQINLKHNKMPEKAI